MYNAAITIFTVGWLILSGSATFILGKFIAAGAMIEQGRSRVRQGRPELTLVWSRTNEDAAADTGAVRNVRTPVAIV